MRRTALLALATLIGCNHEFTDNIAFQAPAGWVYSPAFGHGAAWAKGGGSRELIMAQSTDSPLPTGRHPGWKDISICGNHPAVLMLQRNEPNELWEGVSTTWGRKRFMAIYVRPANVAPDPQAEAAIRSLCLKKAG